jgi:hypothetical protein
VTLIFKEFFLSKPSFILIQAAFAIFFCSFLGILTGSVAWSGEQISESLSPSLASTSDTADTPFKLLRQKFRVENFTEFMTPQLLGDQKSIPDSNGNSLASMNLDGRLWADYEFIHNWRVLYWQRYIVAPGFGFQFYDPRFGIRFTQLLESARLATTVDIYVLPGVSQFATDANRHYSLGARFSSSYIIRESHWTVGAVLEMNYNVYHTGTTGADMTGFIVPYFSYAISSIFATQHWFVFPIKHNQGDAPLQLSWDLTGMPFVQNGIGVKVAKPVWVGVFINNYLLTLPNASITWASLWLNLSFL